jgi:hypothetical protein
MLIKPQNYHRASNLATQKELLYPHIEDQKVKKTKLHLASEKTLQLAKIKSFLEPHKKSLGTVVNSLRLVNQLDFKNFNQTLINYSMS